jgi:hypothetical protein
MSLASRGGERESRDATPTEDDRDDDRVDVDAEKRCSPGPTCLIVDSLGGTNKVLRSSNPPELWSIGSGGSALE